MDGRDHQPPGPAARGRTRTGGGAVRGQHRGAEGAERGALRPGHRHYPQVPGPGRDLHERQSPPHRRDRAPVLLHDVPSVELAHKAVDNGADGLIALCGGAGGHTGTASPFVLVPQIRRFFDGPLALADAVTGGRGVRAAQTLGADYAYMGTRYIATREANVPAAYKELLMSEGTEDVIVIDAVTGLRASFLRGSISRVGLDPDALPAPRALFRPALPEGVKGWRDVWSAGHGVGLIDDTPAVSELVERLRREYLAAAAPAVRQGRRSRAGDHGGTRRGPDREDRP